MLCIWGAANRCVLHKAKKECPRTIFSLTGSWPKIYNGEVRNSLESHWKNRLTEQHALITEANKDNDKYYVLSMFPYPSGKLHMGHVRVYTISDVMARYHRMLGRNVIHPMGWDAFGLPAENAAIERGIPPDKWTYSNIETMKSQLHELCCSFDWDREFTTCDADYYKWTQYIFLKMYEHGLAYQKEGAVNWDPVDQTVLADEQVDEEGRSWRSGVKVERKHLKQWFLRTSVYSKSLLDGLSDVAPQLWRDIIAIQKNWIGACDGVQLVFDVSLGNDDRPLESPLYLFTKQPHCVYGISHILLSEAHYYNDSTYYAGSSDTDTIPLTIKAVNAFTNKPIPVFISKSHDFGDQLNCHVGIPSVSELDRAFAEQHGIQFSEVLDKDNETVINSEAVSGLDVHEAREKILKRAADDLKCGGHVCSDRNRDWLISRQRYWGTPIPMMYCPKYGTMPVPYEDLPVKLPEVSHLTGKGASPLLSDEEWRKVKCPKCDCDSYALRETDTMDTFVDSSWYYLRYTDPKNKTEPFSPSKAHQEMPVDLYIGGKEHAVMHLYYTRFFHHFFHDLGWTPTREPFVNLLTQGMVMGKSYRVKDSGKYLPKQDVDFSGPEPVEKSTGEVVLEDWEKMSKSKYNGVDPQDMLDTFGVDATRLCILVNVAPKSDRHWSDDVYVGVVRWQAKIWGLVSAYRESSTTPPDGTVTAAEVEKYDKELFDQRNLAVKQMNVNMERQFLLSSALSRLQSLTTLLRKVPAAVTVHSAQYDRALCELVVMMTPFAPMFALELWEGLRSVPHKCTDFDWEKPVLQQKWPKVDDEYKILLKVQVNKKTVYSVSLPPDVDDSNLTEQVAIELAKGSMNYESATRGLEPSAYQLTIIPGKKILLNLRIDKLMKGKKEGKKAQGES